MVRAATPNARLVISHRVHDTARTSRRKLRAGEESGDMLVGVEDQGCHFEPDVLMYRKPVE